MRVVALVCVVVGHWLMQGVYIDDDGPHRQGLLGLAPWTHPLTWVLQVMPIFFLAGGYSNALSWRRAVRAGTGYGSWLSWRTRRLTRPLAPLLVFWAIAAPVAAATSPDHDWLRIAGKASLVPTWFIAAYLLIVVLTPVTVRIWDRLGLASIVVGVLVAGLVDAVSLATGSKAVGAVNVIVVWGTMHQVGYAWLDGTLHRGRRRAWLALGGFVALVALVWWGPYGVSMVGVGGFGVDNANPPRVTLLLLGLWQAGVALMLERRLQSLTARPRVWWLVVLVESRLMTVYLWHLTVLGILLAASLWSGVGLTAVPDTAQWWLALPLWLVALAATTCAVCFLLGRYEQPPDSRPTVPAHVSLAEALTIAAVVAVLARYGLVPHGHVLWYVPLAASILLVVGARAAARNA